MEGTISSISPNTFVFPKIQVHWEWIIQNHAEDQLQYKKLNGIWTIYKYDVT